MTRVLLPEWQELSDEFDLMADGVTCSCMTCPMPPCWRCTHPGNPLNLEDTEEAWIDAN